MQKKEEAKKEKSKENSSMKQALYRAMIRLANKHNYEPAREAAQEFLKAKE